MKKATLLAPSLTLLIFSATMNVSFAAAPPDPIPPLDKSGVPLGPTIDQAQQTEAGSPTTDTASTSATGPTAAPNTDDVIDPVVTEAAQCTTKCNPQTPSLMFTEPPERVSGDMKMTEVFGSGPQGGDSGNKGTSGSTN